MRVWVTRDEKADGALSSALQARGLIVVHEPVLTRRYVDDADAAIATLSDDDWLVLTSPYAVEAIKVPSTIKPKVAVVGVSSQKVALEKGLRVELVSTGGDAQSLFDELRQRVSVGTVCYPRSSLANPPDAWGDVTLLTPLLYITEPCEFDTTVIDRIDLIALSSPSAVDSLSNAGITLRDYTLASIGPTTSKAIRVHNTEPSIEAPRRTLESLAEAIENYGNDSRHQRA